MLTVSPFRYNDSSQFLDLNNPLVLVLKTGRPVFNRRYDLRAHFQLNAIYSQQFEPPHIVNSSLQLASFFSYGSSSSISFPCSSFCSIVISDTFNHEK